MLKKRLFSALLCLCMMVGMLPAIIPTAQASTNGHTQAEAVQWVKARADENWEINDGSGWTQCTEFVWAYYEYLLGYHVRGNAYDYLGDAYGACPSSWTRPNKSTVQPGDIVIWGQWASFNTRRSDYAKEYGHIGVVVSVSGDSMITAEANAYGSTRGAVMYKYDREVSCISGIIRPDWPSPHPTAPSQNLGDDFYACIKSEVGNVNLENYWGNNVQIATANQRDPRQIWHFIRQSDGSYKIVNMADGCCLDVRDAVYAAGTNIQTHTDNDGNAQRWRLVSCGRDSESVYKIATVVGDYRLDVAGASAASGTNVQLFGDNDWMHAQEFKIIKRSSAAGGLAGYLPTDSYARISFKGNYLQTTGTTIYYGDGRGMDVQLTKSAKNDPRQIWHFMYQPEGYYKIGPAS